MRVSVTTRRPVPQQLRRHAEEKLQRLDRHGGCHEATLHIDHDGRRVPACEVEAVAHMHHVRLVARAAGATPQEAVDRVLDRLDVQVRRRKERVTDRRGPGHHGEAETLADGV